MGKTVTVFIPSISISGTMATCEAEAAGDSLSDRLEVVAKLWNGNDLLETWIESGCGQVAVSESRTVSKGRTYTITVDVTVNGRSQPRMWASETC